ncbi:hypothetical protein ACFLTS_05420 [Chloroflexota bacterium]
MSYINIENKTKLRSYLNKFQEKKRYIMAVDIEAERNLHAYGEKLALIQIFDGFNEVIIDPLQIDNDALKVLFEDRNILKVMYDASSDLSLLKNSSDMEIKSILDLRPAVELLNYEKQDLHSVIAFELGVSLENKTQYQRYNWTTRPIAKEAIEYALNDVIYLLKLKDAILKKLYANKLVEPFLLKNLQIQNKDYARSLEDRHRSIKGYNGLNDGEKAVFRSVFKIREKYAKLYDMPAYHIINKADLINIVKDAGHIDTIRFSKRFGKDAIQAIVDEIKTVVR